MPEPACKSVRFQYTATPSLCQLENFYEVFDRCFLLDRAERQKCPPPSKETSSLRREVVSSRDGFLPRERLHPGKSSPHRMSTPYGMDSHMGMVPLTGWVPPHRIGSPHGIGSPHER